MNGVCRRGVGLGTQVPQAPEPRHAAAPQGARAGMRRRLRVSIALRWALAAAASTAPAPGTPAWRRASAPVRAVLWVRLGREGREAAVDHREGEHRRRPCPGDVLAHLQNRLGEANLKEARGHAPLSCLGCGGGSAALVSSGTRACCARDTRARSAAQLPGLRRRICCACVARRTRDVELGREQPVACAPDRRGACCGAHAEQPRHQADLQ